MSAPPSGAPATQLGERLVSRFAPPSVGAVVGVAGTGKSGLLDYVAAALTARGVSVVRLAGRRDSADTPFHGLATLPGGPSSGDVAGAVRWLADELGRPPWMLVVDDAHVLDAATLTVVTRVAEHAVAAGGGVLAAYRPTAGHPALDTLAAVLRGDLGPLVLGSWTAARAAALPTVAGDLDRAARLVAASGGNPRLTVMLARADSPVPATAAAAIRVELDALPDRARRLAAALAAGRGPAAADAAEVAALVSAGLVDADGGLAPLVRDVLAGPAGAPAPGGAVGPAGPDVPAADLVEEAERRWRAGDVFAAIAAADRVLDAGADVGSRAAAIAAAGAAADGDLLDAADRWRRVVAALGAPRGVWASARAALAAALAGDLAAAERDLAEARRMLPLPGPRGLAVALDGVDALLDALRGRFRLAGGRIAVVAASAVPLDPLAPAQWDELAVTIMAAGGDEQAAARLLAEHGERTSVTRRLLLRAWLDLRTGRVGAARDGLAAVGAAPMLRRDAVLRAAVAVGIRRRGPDRAALRAIWQRVAPDVAGAVVEPLLLDVWGELSVAAALVAPADAPAIAQGIADGVDRAGRPTWCAAAESWWAVERAAAAGDAAAARAAAARLAALAGDTRIAGIAHAAGVWAAVLDREVDPVEVVAAAGRLADAGRTWAGAALYRAAAQAAEPSVAAALRRRGRRLSMRATAGATGPGGLTDREREVGALLLDGLTHREIGQRLYISHKTVEQHVARLRQKLVATTRAQLIAALRARLGAPEG